MSGNERLPVFRGQRRAIELPSPPPALAAPDDKPLRPLSPAQERLWFLYRLDPGSTLYNVTTAFRLRGPVDTGALQEALGMVAERQQVLRTVYQERDGEPLGFLQPSRLPLEEHRWERAGAPNDEAVRDMLCGEAAKSFDLETGPVFRATLTPLGEGDRVLTLGVHHIAWDGWSRSVFCRELSAAYRACLRREASPLAPLPLQYAEYALRQRRELTDERLRRQQEFWARRLAGAPSRLPLPVDFPEGVAGRDRTAGSWRFQLDPGCLEGARGLAREENATLFVVLLAAFQALLYRWTGEPDVVVGTDVAGRRDPDVEALIGFFLNHLVLRTHLGGNPTFRELVGRCRETVLGAFDHQELPFDRVVSALQPGHTLDTTPLFHVLFVLQNMPRTGLALDGIQVAPQPFTAPASKFDLSLFVSERDGALHGLWLFRTRLFREATIAGLARQYESLVRAVLADPGRRLHAIDLPGAVIEESVPARPPLPNGSASRLSHAARREVAS